MKTIILPVDFSDHSRHAIAYTINLFGIKYQYLLLHTYFTANSGATSLRSMQQVLQEESIKNLDELVSDLEQEHGDALKLKSRSMEGTVAECCSTIVRSDENIYLIAMGTKGASGLRKVLLGSNTASVIRQVDCSVLAVPLESVVRAPKRIGWATDYTDVGKKDVLAPLKELLELYTPELSMVHIQVEDDNSYGNAENKPAHLNAFLGAHKHRRHEISAESIQEGLETFIDEQNIDMLVFVEHQYGFIERLFHSSVTKEAAMYARVPLLAIQDFKKSGA